MNNNTSKVVTTVFTTEGRTGILLLRRGSELNGGVLIAKGNQYGCAGACRSTSYCHSRRPSFVARMLSRFPTRGIVTFFQRLKVCPGSEGKCLCPFSSRTDTIHSMLRRRMCHLKISMHAKVSYAKVRGAGRQFSLRASRNSLAMSRIVLYGNSGTTPSANSSNSKCTLTGRLKRRVVPMLPTLYTLRYAKGRFHTVTKMHTRKGISLFISNRLATTSANRLRLATCKVSKVPMFRVDHCTSGTLCRRGRIITVLSFLPRCSISRMGVLLGRHTGHRPRGATRRFFANLFRRGLTTM